MVAEKLRPSPNAETVPAWKEQLSSLCVSMKAFADYQDNTSFVPAIMNEACVKSNVPRWHADDTFPDKANFYAALNAHLVLHAAEAERATARAFSKIFSSDNVENLDGVEKLVGQRVEAVWEDKDGSTDWFPATIVAHWPTTSEHDRLLMHFDDGMDEIITLPDDTVRLTGEAVVARCKCARCAVRPEAEDGGCTLPLPQPARPRRRS